MESTLNGYRCTCGAIVPTGTPHACATPMTYTAPAGPGVALGNTFTLHQDRTSEILAELRVIRRLLERTLAHANTAARAVAEYSVHKYPCPDCGHWYDTIDALDDHATMLAQEATQEPVFATASNEHLGITFMLAGPEEGKDNG